MHVSIFFGGIDVEKWSPFFACFKHPFFLWLLVVLKFPFPVSFGFCWKLALMYFYQKPYRHYADVMSSFTGCLAARLLWLGYHASPNLSNISWKDFLLNTILHLFICMSWWNFGNVFTLLLCFARYFYAKAFCVLKSRLKPFLWIWEIDW